MKHPMIYGAICGDVIGSVYEQRLMSTKNYDFGIFPAMSRFTDDTAMTIAVADWLTTDASLSHQGMVDALVKWARRYPHAGYGGTFHRWFEGEDHRPYNSWGNGSAMRVSPVGFAFNTIEETLRVAKITAEVTHNHPEGIKGAQATAAAIFMARTGSKKWQIKEYIEKTFGYDLSRRYEDIKPGYSFDVSCQGSVPESIICFLESTCYEDCIRKAIAMGGDADTMAAIAGGIAAAYYDEMPDNLYEVAERKMPADFKAVIAAFTKKVNKDNVILDSIRGSLMAGAAGDALGYPVEFMKRSFILQRYGEQGITKFELNKSGIAEVSDDTQMTLFTINGMLMGLTRGYMRGIGGRPENYVEFGYMDWYYTQTHKEFDRGSYTWLKFLPELAHRRAPGNTCLTAIESMINDKEPHNNSKGCGGIMRVAPIGLLAAVYPQEYNLKSLANAGARIAWVTHKHPLGYLPSGLLAVFISHLVPLTPEEVKDKLPYIIRQTFLAMDEMHDESWRADDADSRRLLDKLTQRAIDLAQSDVPDEQAFHELGEGWVAEEAWAISLYCSLKYIDDMEKAITVAVNHDGDSDSTGAITGNIMGAIYGYEYMKERNMFCPEGKELEETLELSEITLALADDLYYGCPISEYDSYDTPRQRQWCDRYCENHPCGIKTSLNPDMLRDLSR